MKLFVTSPATVYGIYFYKGYTLVHSGKNLYKVTSGGQKTIIFSELNQNPSDAFVFEDIWYFKDGKHYLRYDGSEIKEAEGYIPTTSIARKPSGGGTDFAHRLYPRVGFCI